jgi:transposase
VKRLRCGCPFGRADQCAATPCATTSGSGSSTCCPAREGHVDVTAEDDRLFGEAVLYRYRAGMPWRDLPERFGGWKKVHTRFGRWARTGVWARVFARLVGEADNKYAMIDSTVVRAHHLASSVTWLNWGHALVSAWRLCW